MSTPPERTGALDLLTNLFQQILDGNSARIVELLTEDIPTKTPPGPATAEVQTELEAVSARYQLLRDALSITLVVAGEPPRTTWTDDELLGVAGVHARERLAAVAREEHLAQQVEQLNEEIRRLTARNTSLTVALETRETNPATDQADPPESEADELTQLFILQAAVVRALSTCPLCAHGRGCTAEAHRWLLEGLRGNGQAQVLAVQVRNQQWLYRAWESLRVRSLNPDSGLKALLAEHIIVCRCDTVTQQPHCALHTWPAARHATDVHQDLHRALSELAEIWKIIHQIPTEVAP